jgi:hypothetical protein
LLHLRNRRDAATLTTTGSFSFSKCWREGSVYTVLGRDGRHVLIATERKGDPHGPEIRGDVYLLNNETLQVRKLEQRPHTLSWRSAEADDAEWMSGKSHHRLAPILTEASSWTSDRSAQRILTWPLRAM